MCEGGGAVTGRASRSLLEGLFGAFAAPLVEPATIIVLFGCSRTRVFGCADLISMTLLYVDGLVDDLEGSARDDFKDA